MAHLTVNHKALNEKAKKCRVYATSQENAYDVESTSGSTYRVTIHGKSRVSCTCDRQKWIGRRNAHTNACSHARAGIMAHYGEQGMKVTFRCESQARTLRRKRKVVHALTGDFGGNQTVTARRSATVVKPVKVAHNDNLSVVYF